MLSIFGKKKQENKSLQETHMPVMPPQGGFARMDQPPIPAASFTATQFQKVPGSVINQRTQPTHMPAVKTIGKVATTTRQATAAQQTANYQAKQRYAKGLSTIRDIIAPSLVEVD